MKKVYDVFTDPSHGWIKVKLSELKSLGIEDKITPFSFTRGEYAYLEEDCDFSTFHDAKRTQGVEIKFKNHHTNKYSKIRSYQRYTIGT
jgi:hypothetical protein